MHELLSDIATMSSQQVHAATIPGVGEEANVQAARIRDVERLRRRIDRVDAPHAFNEDQAEFCTYLSRPLQHRRPRPTVDSESKRVQQALLSRAEHRLATYKAALAAEGSAAAHAADAGMVRLLGEHEAAAAFLRAEDDTFIARLERLQRETEAREAARRAASAPPRRGRRWYDAAEPTGLRERDEARHAVYSQDPGTRAAAGGLSSHLRNA